jgi:hypothetical protein
VFRFIGGSILFAHALGANWVIVTASVPALLVSSYLIIVESLRAKRAA